MEKHIVIIGAGPAGVEAALSAAPYAAQVTLISAGPVGDWGQLLVSRIWLQALERQLNAAHFPEAFDLEQLSREARTLADTWSTRHRDRLRALNIDIIEGRAALAGPDQVQVDDRTLHADAIIIASGTRPIFPPGFAPDGRRVFSPGTIDAMRQLPKSLILIGDGPVGFEYAHLFSLLGISIDWLVLEGGPRSTFDAEIDAYLLPRLQERGVRVHAGPAGVDLDPAGPTVTRTDGRRFAADAVFISIGFRSALDDLGLDRAGLAPDERGFLPADGYGRTAVPSIYFAAYPGTVSFSRTRGRIAALHALGRPVAPFDSGAIVVPFHLCPQVAQVGRLSADDGSIATVTAPFADALKPHLIGRTDGFFKLAWDRERKITGAAAVGEQAADALTPIGLAIKLGGTIDDLADLYGPHPTVSELPYAAARRAVEQAG